MGGKLESLVPPSERQATMELDVANKLAGERLQELERRKRGKELFGIEVQTTLRRVRGAPPDGEPGRGRSPPSGWTEWGGAVGAGAGDRA